MGLRTIALVAASAVLMAACGSNSTESSATTSTDTTAGTTAPPATAPPAAAKQIPITYDDVAADHAMAVEELLTEGRSVADDVLASDADALFARFAPVMASQFGADELEATFVQIAAKAPLGSRLSDRALRQGPDLGLYLAQIEWGSDIVQLTAVFDENGDVAGLSLDPTPPAPPPVEDASEVEFRLPFDGLWFVFWGGDTPIDNYHVIAPDQRYAYDLVVWKNGATHEGDPSLHESYWAYGQPILAPAAGTVVTVVDGLPDQTPAVGSDPRNPAGNHVVIEVADGEYVLIAHMQPDSLVVAEGDTVAAGDHIGSVGNSGNTSEPHIHIHLQDRPTFSPGASGLPLAFSGYVADGELVERGRPTADQFIRHG